jgi:hypothetical protein
VNWAKGKTMDLSGLRVRQDICTTILCTCAECAFVISLVFEVSSQTASEKSIFPIIHAYNPELCMQASLRKRRQEDRQGLVHPSVSWWVSYRTHCVRFDLGNYIDFFLVSQAVVAGAVPSGSGNRQQTDAKRAQEKQRQRQAFQQVISTCIFHHVT